MKTRYKFIGALSLIGLMALLPIQYVLSESENYAAPATGSGVNQLAVIDEEIVPLAGITDRLIPCTIGLLTYYNQADPRWADALYGTSDPMKSHGCGPTAVAMIVSSYSGTHLTPLEAADWASANGYCSQGEGSKHQLIPDALTNYGLTVSSIEDRSIESILNNIRNGKIVVALMNKGYFTNGGHFLLLTEVTEDGKIRIADPASWDNSQISWDPEFILNQVRTRSEGGGPLWAVGMPSEES